MRRSICGRRCTGRIDGVCQGLFAGKPAPTWGMHFKYGSGLAREGGLQVTTEPDASPIPPPANPTATACR